MKYTTPSEVMLALRAPDSGWLGVLACVIDEASRDPQFDQRQRRLAVELLGHGPLPETMANAARQRAACFEAELDELTLAEPAPAPAPERPKLTLVGSPSH
jgi:hypothetical protein